MCRILFWRLRKGYTQSDGEKDALLFLGNYTVLHLIRPCPVRMVFFSKLFPFSGIDFDGVRSGSFFSAAVVPQGPAAGTGNITGQQGG